MPRPRKKIPTYRLHKASGQARSTIDGKDYWFGPWNTPESLVEYSKLLDRLGRGELEEPVPLASAPAAAVSVNELCVRFVKDQFPRYKAPNPSSTPFF